MLHNERTLSPIQEEFLHHLNRRAKIKLRCQCFVNCFLFIYLFFCGDAVFVIVLLCGVAVLRVPQCPPPSVIEVGIDE